ncbi:hypothetical protein CJO92_22840 (plasmid) [Ralstonia solanacearum]|uniref:Uncharacterized protein n=1 Tax=Ralstonia solanacearum TaxID=305 RepID=A0AAD0SH80_RALSL|nr:hypothetical protein CJO77_22825 [Ralstonia solanacearum]AXW55471.1 hypothetical protein CJO92_22840 [Ralstonia solanacearum]CBJ35659.1 hypothethical protein [Ralstonia solanacearum PSI07]
MSTVEWACESWGNGRLPPLPVLQRLQLSGVGPKGFSFALVLGLNIREDNSTGGRIKEAGGCGNSARLALFHIQLSG